MYDFSLQKDMLGVSLELLKEKDLLHISALGGGTALAAYYWNHRYSTDIDIFIYSDTKTIDNLRPNLWSDNIKNQMDRIGYIDEFKMHPIYTEFAINEDSKMQFFDVTSYSKNPYTKVKLWDLEFNIESIGEIIAKKIQYRSEKGNARDLFDIALAIHKEADIFQKLKLKFSKIVSLYETVQTIKDDTKLLEQYQNDIKQMNPADEYLSFAFHTIPYLAEFLESYINAYNMGIVLDNEELFMLEEIVYKNIKQL
jgi:predicted nucleotidyltransferase component of viral defense system